MFLAFSKTSVGSYSEKIERSILCRTIFSKQKSIIFLADTSLQPLSEVFVTTLHKSLDKPPFSRPHFEDALAESKPQVSEDFNAGVTGVRECEIFAEEFLFHRLAAALLVHNPRI